MKVPLILLMAMKKVDLVMLQVRLFAMGLLLLKGLSFNNGPDEICLKVFFACRAGC